ncbi:MAG: putative redox protein [Mycobacterium sp.]|nr:putative redox protein [Mycobacterium sp.]
MPGKSGTAGSAPTLSGTRGSVPLSNSFGAGAVECVDLEPCGAGAVAGAAQAIGARTMAGTAQPIVAAAKEDEMTTTQDETTGDTAPLEGTVIVTEAGTGTYRQEITAGDHRLVADEPPPVGDDAGPTPYDLLLAALGACTSMTVRMYADRKGWLLERVRVTLRHSRIHAQDCVDCETRNGWIDHIDRDVELTGDLDDSQRERLMHIADRCPVHQTLTSEVRIATTLR